MRYKYGPNTVCGIYSTLTAKGQDLPCQLPIRGREAGGEREGESKRVRAVRKKWANRVWSRRKKRGQGGGKKVKAKEVSCVFQLLIGPVGACWGISQGDAPSWSLVSHWSDDRGWHKQNSRGWTTFEPGMNPSHAPLLSWIILFVLFLYLPSHL